MKIRAAWELAVLLAMAVLGGIRSLMRPYWVAKCRGQGAHLRGAPLPYARPITAANLSGADLRGADLTGAGLCQVRLEGANLRGAHLEYADLTGAKYDAHTRWPSGYDPTQHEAVMGR